MDLEDIADLLYAEAPAGFTARRSELAAAVLQGEGRDLAEQVKQLRKPTVAAWLVNQLARSGDELGALLELGERMRQAQANLDGPLMATLGRERQQQVSRLLRRARVIATDRSQGWTAALEREVEATAVAALADPEAAAAVASGRLTRALSYAGLGEVDVSEATATPLSPRRAPAGPTADADPGRAAREAAARDAAAEREAAGVLDEARTHARELTRRVRQAERDLDVVRRDLERAVRAVEDAENAHRAAAERAIASQAAAAPPGRS